MATIKKNQTAEIPTKSGNKYSYQYVDIAQIHEYLEENKMSYYQYIDRIDNDDYIMTVKIIDGVEQKPLRGSRVVDATLFGNDNPAQKQGSALTYARRYSLLMAFGLATEDNDANDLNIVKDVTQEEADNYKLTFGKYKGMTLKEVQKQKPDYIDWLLGNTKDERMIKLIELATGKAIPSEEEQKETLDKLIELNSLLLKCEEFENFNREKLFEHYEVKNTREMTLEQINDAIDLLKKRVK